MISNLIVGPQHEEDAKQHQKKKKKKKKKSQISTDAGEPSAFTARAEKQVHFAMI